MVEQGSTSRTSKLDREDGCEPTPLAECCSEEDFESNKVEDGGYREF